MTIVNSNERVDELQRKGYRLIQNPEVFCFGIDAVLLEHFAKVTKGAKDILDIGTGTGIIPILMHAMYGKRNFTGIDVQEEMIEMATRSVQLNEIEEDVQMRHVDIKDYKEAFKQHSFDLVTCNPPYMKGTTGLKNDHPSKTIARHEILCTLEDILMHAMYGKRNFTGIDVQEEMIEMATRSVQLNEIEEDVQMRHVDIKDYKEAFKQHSFDLVTCNPPYMKGTTGLKNDHPSNTIARHEILCTLEDIIDAASYVLKDKGKFCMIHRPQRLVDIIYGMKVRGIEPKRMRMVHGKANTAPTMVLVEGVKNGGSEMRVEAPLIVYRDDNTYTQELLAIYECEEKKR